MAAFNFGTITETDRRTGRLLAVYFEIRKGKAAEVREVVDGVAFANYDRKGRLLGVELLAPCSIAVLDRVARNEPSKIRTFLKNSIPRKMALAS